MSNLKYLIIVEKDFFICGNGFVIDELLFIGGFVEIFSNNDGFISDKNELEIYWLDFYDDEMKLSYEYFGIVRYEVFLGNFSECFIKDL